MLIFDPQFEELFAKFSELLSFPNYSSDCVYFTETKIPGKYCLPHYKQVGFHNKPHVMKVN